MEDGVQRNAKSTYKSRTGGIGHRLTQETRLKFYDTCRDEDTMAKLWADKLGNTHSYVVVIERPIDQAESVPGDQAKTLTH